MTEGALSVGRPLGLGHLEGPVPAGAEPDGLEDIHRPGHLLGDGGEGGGLEGNPEDVYVWNCPGLFSKNRRERDLRTRPTKKIFLRRKNLNDACQKSRFEKTTGCAH